AIGLAWLSSTCVPQPDCSLENNEGILRSFFPRNKIQPSLQVQCKFPVSLISNSVVGSYAGIVNVDGYFVNNAYELLAPVRRGDSGGLIYRDDQAVGIVFAHSDSGMAWFHPLKDAFSFLQQISPVKIACF